MVFLGDVRAPGGGVLCCRRQSSARPPSPQGSQKGVIHIIDVLIVHGTPNMSRFSLDPRKSVKAVLELCNPRQITSKPLHCYLIVLSPSDRVGCMRRGIFNNFGEECWFRAWRDTEYAACASPVQLLGTPESLAAAEVGVTGGFNTDPCAFATLTSGQKDGAFICYAISY